MTRKKLDAETMGPIGPLAAAVGLAVRTPKAETVHNYYVD